METWPIACYPPQGLNFILDELVQKITAVLSDLIRARGSEADAILETAEVILKKAVDKVESQVGHLNFKWGRFRQLMINSKSRYLLFELFFHASNLD